MRKAYIDLIDVDLEEDDAIVFSAEPFKLRRYHSARTAPSCGEVDNDLQSEELYFGRHMDC